MAVNSISASGSQAATLVPQQKQPPAPPAQTAAATAPNQANQPNKPVAPEPQTQQVQQPKPVVNTQGQTIGRNISLKA